MYHAVTNDWLDKMPIWLLLSIINHHLSPVWLSIFSSGLWTVTCLLQVSDEVGEISEEVSF